MYHPFDALFDFQRALESRLDSDWLRGTTAGTGAFPPVVLSPEARMFL
jgi:hypothetical protein